MISQKLKAAHFATDRLRTFREARGWTQKQFANWLSLETNQPISRETLNYWETGRRGMTADLALLICDATEIPIMDLVTRRDA